MEEEGSLFSTASSGFNLCSCCCCSVTQSCPALCDSMDCSTRGFLVFHCFPEFVQTHVHWVSDAIQPFHPLSPPSPLALNLFQHQGLIQWVSSSHQVAKVLEFQLESFQWIFSALGLRMIWSPYSSRDSQESSPTPQFIALTRWTSVGKVVPLLFNTLSRFVNKGQSSQSYGFSSSMDVRVGL